MMTQRPTLLLVHGAWHGAWCWETLQDVLETRGWIVRTVDLPTIHSDDPATLTMYDDARTVADAVDAIGGPVVVVAHSYGGIPVTQGATSPNVLRIVYIAAFVLDEGESLLSSVGGVAPDWWNVEGDLATAGVPGGVTPVELFYADVEPGLAAASAARLLPQSVRPFSDPLTVVAWKSVPTAYVITESDAVFPLPAEEALAARAGSTIRRLNTSHSPFLSQPEATADIIEEAALA